MGSKMSRIQKYLLEGLVGAFLFLFASWGIGYYANALCGMHFDLASCWGGIGAVSGGGVLAAVKYIADSWPNSEQGRMPYERKDDMK